MVRFLFDAILFNLLPYYTPTVTGALTVITWILLVHSKGCMYGTIYWLVSFFLLWRQSYQWYIIQHRSRSIFGFSLGLVISIFLSFHFYVRPHVHRGWRTAAVALTAATLYFMVAFHRQPPIALQEQDRYAMLCLASIG